MSEKLVSEIELQGPTRGADVACPEPEPEAERPAERPPPRCWAKAGAALNASAATTAVEVRSLVIVITPPGSAITLPTLGRKIKRFSGLLRKVDGWGALPR